MNGPLTMLLNYRKLMFLSHNIEKLPLDLDDTIQSYDPFVFVLRRKSYA